MHFQLITTNQELAAVCAQASQSTMIALDTEFIRVRTYYPHLGLLQLFDGQQVTLVDPLQIDNWQPFIDLLANPQVIKLLHAAGEDLEVFNHQFGQLPLPFVDTQVLAAFCGYSLSSGFAMLVEDYLQISLDKSETRTDWLARPLTARQQEYAAADVFYLLPLAQKLLQQVEERNLLSAALEECVLQGQRRSEVLTSEQAYLEITNAWQLIPKQLAVLQRLASWRLCYAREQDIAVNFVVREEHLLAVAQAQPTSLAELDKLGLTRAEIRLYGNILLTLVQQALTISESKWPKKIVRLNEYPGYKQLFKRIKEVVQRIAEETGLSVELLASRKQINRLLSWYWFQQKQDNTPLPDLLTGWRKILLADRLFPLLTETIE